MNIKVFVIVVFFLIGADCSEKSGITFPGDNAQEYLAECSTAETCGACLKLTGCGWCEKRVIASVRY